MSDKSAISWTDATWNPVSGCDRVSPGCDHCYALTLAKRLKAMGNPKYQTDGDPRTSGPGFGVSLHPDALDIPAHWRKPKRVFVNSMADLFHADVPDGYIARVWDVMGQNQQHTYQILTKRHARMRSWLTRWADRTADREGDKASGMPPMPRGPGAVRSAYSSGRARLFADMLDSMGEPPEGCAYPLYDWMDGQRFWGRDLFNVWCGVSVENQKWADIRIPSLLESPAAVRFLSCEPLLGEIDFRGLLGHGIGWVIAGGESGPGHRVMNIDWLAWIVQQCQDADVPVWVKQASGPRAGQQGRIPDELWLHQFPGVPLLASA
jgi:protein gp37